MPRGIPKNGRRRRRITRQAVKRSTRTVDRVVPRHNVATWAHVQTFNDGRRVELLEVGGWLYIRSLDGVLTVRPLDEGGIYLKPVGRTGIWIPPVHPARGLQEYMPRLRERRQSNAHTAQV